MDINLTLLQTSWDLIWEDPIGWFLGLPLLIQILLLIGIIALTIATLFLVYYILKGVAYLLYYLFKGLYYLLKGIFVGLYRLIEALYYAISGKPKKKKGFISPTSEPLPIPIPQKTTRYEKDVLKIPSYCTECGQKLTESMQSLLVSRGSAFCFHCGMQFELKSAQNLNF